MDPASSTCLLGSGSIPFRICHLMGLSVAKAFASQTLLLAAVLGANLWCNAASKEQPRTLEAVSGEEELQRPLHEISFQAEQSLAEDPHLTMRAYLKEFQAQQQQQQQQQGTLPIAGDTWQLGDPLALSPCGVTGSDSTRPARESLVVVPAGDTFDAARWMTDPARSNWDLVVIYYGRKDSYRCPLCKAVYRGAGPKWRLAWGFTLLPEWQEYRGNYSAIMFADDDLSLDMCTINTVFTAMKAYGLLMAQPSLCPLPWRQRQAGKRSFTPWPQLYQQPSTILRSTTMLEIMAPAFQMDFFQRFIRPSLYNAHVGWGLDFVWPFLLHYPRDKIAVVDLVCMLHPPSAPSKAGSVYSADAPYEKKEEETRRFVEFGYYKSEIEKLGFKHMPVVILGALPSPHHGNWELQALQLPALVCGCLLLVCAMQRSRWRRGLLSWRRRQRSMDPSGTRNAGDSS